MTNTELLVLAENLGHKAFFLNMPESKSVSFSDGDCYIGIDKSLTPMKERELLAHELGHCESAGFYYINTPVEVRRHIENRANRWAYNILTPVDEIQTAFHDGITEYWELADHFNVTCEFMYNALTYYKETAGIQFYEAANDDVMRQ